MLPAPVQASIDQLDREAAACEAKARVCRSLADDLRRAHGLPTATSMPDVASTSVVSTSVAAVEAAKRAMPPRRPAIARAPRPRPVAVPAERGRTDDAPASTSPPAPPAPVNPAPIARTSSGAIAPARPLDDAASARHAAEAEATVVRLVDEIPRLLEGLEQGLEHVELARRFDQHVGSSNLRAAINRLRQAGTIVRVDWNGKTKYRRPIAGLDRPPTFRSVPVPDFDPLALTQKIVSILASGASYDLVELVNAARSTLPYADKSNVNKILEELVAAGTHKSIVLGVRVRYVRAEAAAS